jgi:hypothetical protein
MSSSEENRRTIRRDELQRRLARVAQVRAIFTSLCIVPALLIVAALDATGFVPPPAVPIVGLTIFFAVPGLFCLILTYGYCRSAVRCPNCGESLWCCGTGSFKPRRMRVRDEVAACPQCAAPIR